MAVSGHHGDIRVTAIDRGPGEVGNKRSFPFCDIVRGHAPEVGIGMGHESFFIDSNTVDLKIITLCTLTLFIIITALLGDYYFFCVLHVTFDVFMDWPKKAKFCIIPSNTLVIRTIEH